MNKEKIRQGKKMSGKSKKQKVSEEGFFFRVDQTHFFPKQSGRRKKQKQKQ